MKSLILTVSISFCCCLFLLSCTDSSTSESPNENASEIPQNEVLKFSKKDLEKVGVAIGALKYGTYEKTVFASGIIDLPPQNVATISLYTPGIVSGIKVYPGVKVKKGDILCEVSHPDIISLQEEYLKSKAQLNQVSAEASRMNLLAKEEAVAQKKSQIAEAELRSLTVRIQSLKQKIEEIGLSTSTIETAGICTKVPVRATLSGFIQDVLVNQGKMVQMGEPLFNLIDPSHMHLELKVFEKDASSISDGQSITFATKSEPNVWYPAYIYVAGKALDAQSGTVSIHGHFHQENHKLLAGSTVSAKVKVGQAQGIVIPSGAFVKSESKALLYQVINETKDSVAIKSYSLSDYQQHGSELIISQLPNKSSKWIINGADMIYTATLGEEEE